MFFYSLYSSTTALKMLNHIFIPSTKLDLAHTPPSSLSFP